MKSDNEVTNQSADDNKQVLFVIGAVFLVFCAAASLYLYDDVNSGHLYVAAVIALAGLVGIGFILTGLLTRK